MKFWQETKRLAHISRPAGWLIGAALYGDGVARSGQTWQTITYIGLLFFTFPMGIIIFGLNDVADKASDSINARKGGVGGAVVRSDETALIVKLAIIFSVLFEAIFIISGHPLLALAALYIILFGYIYSVKPLRLKTRPVLDSLSNGLWVAAIFIGGYLASATSLHAHLPAFPRVIFLTGAAFHILFAAADYRADKKVGDRTIAVLLGERLSLLLVAVLFGLCLFIDRHSAAVLKTYFALAVLASLLLVWRPLPKLIYKTTFGLAALAIATLGYLFIA